MTSYVIEKASLPDAQYLASRLRKEDVQEIYALRGLGPLEALRECLTRSDQCYVARFERPIMMFGVVIASPSEANIWMLGTDELSNHSKRLVKDAPSWVAKFLSEYNYLSNYVDCRNQVHIKWIKWLGFTVSRTPKPMGFERRPFAHFHLRGN